MSLYEVDIQRSGRRRTLWRWFLLHPKADYVWALLLVLVWLGLAVLAQRPLMLENVGTDARRTLFQTLATLAGATAGLTLTSVSMLINVLGKKAAPGQQELPLERLTASPADRRGLSVRHSRVGASSGCRPRHRGSGR